MRNTEQKTFLALDGLRGVAAICIMIYHFSRIGHGIPLPDQQRLFTRTYLAVDLFFVLSGFVIYHSYAPKLCKTITERQYILKRIIRLYPMHLLGLCIGLISACLLLPSINGKLGLTDLLSSFPYTALFLPYAHNFDISAPFPVPLPVGMYPLNLPVWSLFFEISASILFLFIHDLTPRRLYIVCGGSLTLMVLASLIATYGTGMKILVPLGSNAATFAGGFPRVIFEFTMGMLLCRAHATGNIFARTWRWMSSPFCLYPALVVALIQPFQLKGAATVVFILVLTPLFVLAGAYSETKSDVANRISMFLGWISYPLYCVHLPVATLVYLYGGRNGKSEVWEMAVASGAALAVAAIAAKFFDEPVRKGLSSLVRVSAKNPASAAGERRIESRSDIAGTMPQM